MITAWWVAHVKIGRNGIFLASIFLQYFTGNLIRVGMNYHWNIDKVATCVQMYLAAQGVCGTDNPGSAEFSLDVTSNEPFQDIEVNGNRDVGVTSSITADSNDIHDPIKMVSIVIFKI